MRSATRWISLGCLLISLAGCAKPRPPLEDLSGGQDLSSFTIEQIRGTRSGDRLDAEVTLGDGSSRLTVKMRFVIGAPTKLQSGQWQWSGQSLQSGTVAERSVMFLGGQDGPPSIGGRFDLLDPTGTAKYRVTIPTTALKTKLPTVN